MSMYAYDSAGRVVTDYQSYVGKTIEYVYQTSSPHQLTTKIHDGQVTGGTVLGQYLSQYALDDSPQYLTSPGGSKTQYIYDDSSTGYGLLSQVNYNISAALSGAPYVKYQYDSTNKKRLWLSNVSNFRSDGSTISSFGYTFDNAGNRTRIDEADRDYANYQYDGSYRLRDETRYDSCGNSIYSYEYRYDEIGNRTTKLWGQTAGNPTQTYTYGYTDNNLLTSVSGAASGSFYYDNFGNLQTKSIGGWTYGYDSLNHLTSANSISIKYDPLGRRIEKVGSSGTTRYVYDGGNMIAEANSSNVIQAWYTDGICETRNGQTFYYTCDGLGSTHELSDTMQRVTDAYAYNAWGENQGQLRLSTDANKPVNPLRFVGKSGYYSDDDLGLDLLGARYYDPLLGRFITQDPAGEGLNLYEYACDNPVDAIDASGMVPARVDKDRIMLHQVNGALDLIRRVNGYMYDGIKKLLASGKVYYDNEMTVTGLTRGGRITVGQRYNDYITRRGGDEKHYQACADNGDFADYKVDLAATLVHEYVHYNQPTINFDYENPAYSAQYRFLLDLGQANLNGDRSLISSINTAIDWGYADLMKPVSIFNIAQRRAQSWWQGMPWQKFPEGR